MSWRALSVGLAASLVAAVASGCGGDQRGGPPPQAAARQDAATAPQANASARSTRRSSGCPVTQPNHRIPPGQGQNPGAEQAPYYGNGRLWTALYPDGVRERPQRDGSIEEKFPWWRGVRGRLRITGRRLDGRAPTLRARIPDGYGATGFQSTAIIFPTEGCWSVTGTAGKASLSFVTLVVKAGGTTDPHRGPSPSGDERSSWVTSQDARRGYSVRFPESWHRASEPISPKLTDPREILALATFPLRYRPTNCEAFGGAGRSDLGPDDVFLTVQERGYDRDSDWPDFPPRPERFGPTPENMKAAEPACGDRADTDVRWFNFTAAGRYFHVLVVSGSAASRDVRRDAWRILNTLRLDPNVKPDWPASG